MQRSDRAFIIPHNMRQGDAYAGPLLVSGEQGLLAVTPAAAYVASAEYEPVSVEVGIMVELAKVYKALVELRVKLEKMKKE